VDYIPSVPQAKTKANTEILILRIRMTSQEDAGILLGGHFVTFAELRLVLPMDAN
jgi:hypothetical protein